MDATRGGQHISEGVDPTSLPEIPPSDLRGAAHIITETEEVLGVGNSLTVDNFLDILFKELGMTSNRGPLVMTRQLIVASEPYLAVPFHPAFL